MQAALHFRDEIRQPDTERRGELEEHDQARIAGTALKSRDVFRVDMDQRRQHFPREPSPQSQLFEHLSKFNDRRLLAHAC